MAVNKKKNVNKDLCRIITCEARLSYPHLFTPQAPNPKDAKKYSLTLLFPKDRDNTGTAPDKSKRTFNRVIKNAMLAEFGSEENFPETWVSPKKDGDSQEFIDKETRKTKPGYAGHWVVKATSNADTKPVVIDQKMNPITNPADLYPGCYVRAYLFARYYNYMKNEGVHFVVDHVQKLRDGKPFTTKRDVSDVFSPVDVDDEDSADDAEEDFI